MAWLRKSPKPQPPAPPVWELPPLTAFLHDQAPAWEQRTVARPLLEARLADHYRDAQLLPVRTSVFAQYVASLDEAGWRRLALAVSALELPGIRQVLSRLAGRGSVESQVRDGFVKLAASTDVLTLALLGQSELRAEEFARHYAAHLGVQIEGETPELSAARLMRLDYRRLLAEAQRARASAEEQLAYLRKLQEAQENLRRRGKW